MGPKTSMQETFERAIIDLVQIQGERMQLYTEKVQIYYNKRLTEALLIIHGPTLYITNTDGSTYFQHTINVT